ELRAKYVKELELAMTEKALLDRRLVTATAQAEQQKESSAAELGTVKSEVASLQTDLQQALVELIELDGTLRRTQEKSREAEQSLARLQAENRQVNSDKQDLESRLQQSETHGREVEDSVKELQAESRELMAQQRTLENNLQESALKLSKTEQTLAEMVTK